MAMEPTIKYENCEDVFIGPTGIMPTGPAQKRHFNNLEEVSQCDGAGSVYYQDNRNELLKIQNPGFVAPSNQPFYPHLQSAPVGQQEAIPAKRCRRGESAVLFSPPFFEVPESNNGNSDIFTARCVSCQVMLRGHKNVSSNFIKHMKRSHPEVHKMYENYKLLKQHGFGHGMSGMNMNLPPNKPSTGTSEHNLFDATGFLETIPSNTNATGTDATENEQNSETTENSLPNSTADLNDTTENSVDLQINKNELIDASRSEVNLSNKTLQAMSKMFDEKLKSFATKSELNEVTKNIIRQVNSRQSTPCSTIHTEDDDDDNDNDKREAEQDKFKNLQSQLETMRERLASSEHSKQILQRELHSLEKVVRRRKLIINNIPVAPDQQPQNAVEQLFRERFDMPNVQLESVSVIGNRNRLHHDRQILLVAIVHETDVNAIFRKSACLRNTGIYIESQMSQISLKRKEKLLVLRREMLRRNRSLRVMVRSAQLIVCNTYFYWDDLLGLCVGNLDVPDMQLISGDEAAEELKKLTKLDMKEFLSVLKNYDIR
ncbi:uncharacterized protein LOC128857924 isoform X1 [Anastrepha ludens]|uniref:uncharacterized protein LOC128857924 isoform X1 n=1 Tax=Anastrepha ludens TaxID=28586 RepID=UPI0023AF6E8C|nr:uncharacterized protein LOC128857924 isoform X1 [Anastrepha ludens]